MSREAATPLIGRRTFLAVAAAAVAAPALAAPAPPQGRIETLEPLGCRRSSDPARPDLAAARL